MDDEGKHVHKPITSSREAKEKPFKKFLRTFLAEDFDDIRENFVDDYVKPRLTGFKDSMILRTKEFMADSVKDSADMLFLGKKRSVQTDDGRVVVKVDSSGGIRYDQCGDKSKQNTPPSERRGDKVIPYIISDYGEAKRVLIELIGSTKRYPYTKVADYYQLIEQPTIKSDFNFGWTNGMLDNVKIARCDGGYIIELPDPVAVKGESK